MNSPELVDAVKIAKRSPAYRERRASLASPAPADVWADTEDGIFFVLFALRAQDALESFLGFMISMRDYQFLNAGTLSVRFSADGWQAHVSS